MFNADLLSSLKQSQIHLFLPYVKMSHYGFKIQDENRSFRRSLLEKFSNLSFLKSEAVCSSHIKPPQKRALTEQSLGAGGTRKKRASGHKDPGQTGWRGKKCGGPGSLWTEVLFFLVPSSIWCLKAFLEAQVLNLANVPKSRVPLSQAVKVGSRTECSYLCC